MKKMAAGFILGLAASLTVTALADTSSIKLVIDGVDITQTMDVKPQIIDGRTMVPARYVAENLGAEVSWDEDTQTVVIKSTEEEPVSNTNTNTITSSSVSIFSVLASESSVEYGDSIIISVSANKVTTGIRLLDASGNVISENTTYTSDTQGNYFEISYTPDSTGTVSLQLQPGNDSGFSYAFTPLSINVSSESDDSSDDDLEIISITLDEDEVDEDDTVNVTVKTSTNASSVVIKDSDDYKIVSKSSPTSKYSSYYTWTLSFDADEGEIGKNTFYVYVTDSDDNEVSSKFSYKVVEEDSDPVIEEIDIYDEDYIYENSYVDVDITTNTAVYSVRVVDKNDDELAYTTTSTGSGSYYYWELSFYAEYEGSYYIYAADEDGNEVSSRFTIYFVE